jgi:hypothetical protein
MVLLTQVVKILNSYVLRFQSNDADENCITMGLCRLRLFGKYAEVEWESRKKDIRA